MRCFYCKNLEEGTVSESDFSKEESRHLFKVLRGRNGEKVLLIDGKGKIAEAEIAEGKNLEIIEISSPPSPRVRLHLFLAPEINLGFVRSEAGLIVEGCIGNASDGVVIQLKLR